MKSAAVLAAVLALTASAARADPLDDVFSVAKPNTPGCAVGVARRGEAPILRGYGLAEMEHGVPIKPDTIFEAGSVSKQFTAAAILTLVADGKIALSDDIRKYLPEMPSYGAPITIDMLLNHTSGLRDWGEVQAVAGWPRGSRISTHDEVLTIAARQKALNYPPGQTFSYTNTGYNLAAIIVQRVSGQSMPDFTRDRIFKPLGMTRTGWRDDFRKLVPGRAQAYNPGAGGWRLEMPFENVFGNSSLLTTVGDLLIWNQALADGKLGAVGQQLAERATANGGRRIAYARGLFVGAYKGHPEITHDGATAGYRAFTGRFPEQGLAVAVLCNAGNADAGFLAHKAADLYLPAASAPTAAAPFAAPPPELDTRPGLYIGEGTLAITRIVAEGGQLKIQAGPVLQRMPEGHYKAGQSEIRFRSDGTLVRTSADGEVTTHKRETAGWTPTPAELAGLAGTYVSEEADATWIVTVKDGKLAFAPADRPSASAGVNFIFRDGFTRPGGLIRVIRNRSGKVTGLRYQGGRLWNLTLHKVS